MTYMSKLAKKIAQGRLREGARKNPVKQANRFSVWHISTQTPPSRYKTFRAGQIFSKTHRAPISILLGIRKTDGRSEVHSYRFPVEYWSVQQAVAWLKSHKAKVTRVIPARVEGATAPRKRKNPKGEKKRRRNPADVAWRLTQTAPGRRAAVGVAGTEKGKRFLSRYTNAPLSAGQKRGVFAGSMANVNIHGEPFTVLAQAEGVALQRDARGNPKRKKARKNPGHVRPRKLRASALSFTLGSVAEAIAFAGALAKVGYVATRVGTSVAVTGLSPTQAQDLKDWVERASRAVK